MFFFHPRRLRSGSMGAAAATPSVLLVLLLPLLPLLLPGCHRRAVAEIFPSPELLDRTWTDRGDARWCQANEKAALVDLWRSSGGVHWRNHWDLRTDPCVNGWYGIRCDYSGHVTTLNLANNGLPGFLPRSLGNLIGLERLHLNDNLLTGPLPESVSRLTSLVEINLSQNRFTGRMPLVVATFPQMELLHLAANDFEETTMPTEYLQMEQERGVDIWVFVTPGSHLRL